MQTSLTPYFAGHAVSPLAASYSRLVQTPDRVTFGAQPDPTLAVLMDRVTVIDEADMDPKFVANAKAGTRKVLEGFSPALRQALLENGWTVRICPTPQDLTTEDPRLAWGQKQLVEKIKKSKNNPDCIQALQKRVSQVKAENPNHPIIQELDARDLSNLSEEDCHTVATLLMLDLKNINGAVYFSLSKLIILPQTVDNDGFWNNLEKTEVAFEKIVRHETFHFVDNVLDETTTGKSFSDSDDFLEAVRADRTKAKKRQTWLDCFTRVPKTWPHFLAQVPDGHAKGSPLEHYFPSDLFGEESFGEPFAEIGASMTGGGAVNPKMVQGIYVNASKVVEQQVFQRYGMETNSKSESGFFRIGQWFRRLSHANQP